jgi:hypothetical protein
MFGHNDATRARWPRAAAGRPTLPIAMPAPLFPPSPASTRMRPHWPPFPSLGPRYQADFSKQTPTVVPSPFCPFPSSPCLSHRSRAPPSLANHPVGLSSTVSHRDLAGAAALLPFLGASPSESLLSQSMTLTHLPLSLRLAGCVADRRGPPEAIGVIRAPPSRSSCSALTSPARSGGFPPSSRCPAHSLCNTVTLGVGPATPRAPAR